MSDVPPASDSNGKAFGRAYWMLNCIEAFERLAYFGIRSVVPIYIMQATEPGGLHLTAMHKGSIYAWWAIFQSFLPIVTGGIADRYGYKKLLVLAISMNAAGYVMMANLHDYMGFFAGILVLATGTAFFKPALQGSLAQSLTKANSSLGWGVFYWVVNVGAVTAPIIATAILGRPHSAEGWTSLFYACAGFTLCNLLLLFTFKDVQSGSSKTESPLQVLWKTIVNIFHLRLLVWLAIMSCFWLMMYQLWDLHPNFITDWVDSSQVAPYVFENWTDYNDRGQIGVQQQMLLNVNAALIVLLMVPVAWASRKMRTLSAMLVGMCVATVGVVVAGMTGNAWFLLVGIVFFSLGEMWTGPKKNEYLGLIAPPGKKALYLGYVNIPVGIGLFFGSYLAGYVYDTYGEKATLALKELGARTELVGRAARSADWSDSLEIVPGLLGIERGQALALASGALGKDEAGTTAYLEEVYRDDSGHLTNLGLLWLTLHAEKRDAAKERLVEALAKEKDEGRQALGRSLTAGEVTLEDAGLGQVIDLLPGAVGLNRPQVFEVVRALVNEGLTDQEKQEDEAIIAMLHARFAGDAASLNNLALEYLAQATDHMATAASGMTFVDPVKELPGKLGIGRPKSFAALAAALGADDAAVDQALLAIGPPPDGVDLRPAAHLASLPHHRFHAISRRDWSRDVGFLTELIEGDPAAMAVVTEELGSPAGNAGRGVYGELADREGTIRAALAVKDWTKSPDHAARLLGLGMYEARTLVSVDVGDSATGATQLLWDEYDPQYRVWIPFASIGLAAIIALAIFGQMAKRWTDMNA